MKKCISCGAIIEDEDLFCYECGASQEVEVKENQDIEPEEALASEIVSTEPSKAKNFNWVAVLLIIVVGCAISVYFVSKSKIESLPVESEEVTATVDEQEQPISKEPQIKSSSVEDPGVSSFSEEPDLIFFELNGPVKEADYCLNGENIHLFFDEAGKLLSINGRTNYLSSSSDIYQQEDHQDEFVFQRDQQNRLARWLNKQSYLSGKYTWSGNKVISCDFGGESEGDCYKEEYSYNTNRRLLKVIRTEKYVSDYEDDTPSTTPSKLVFQIFYDEYDKHGNWISRHSECTNTTDIQPWQMRWPMTVRRN